MLVIDFSLLTVQPEAMQIPTIASLRSLYDKFELDSKVAEKVTSEKREGETNLINSFVATDVMSKAMKFVADKGLIPNDEYEFKDALKRIWFSQYARENNVISSSGFESVFLAEKVNTEITGLHNWIYFNEQESAGKANYLGYIKEAKLGSVSISYMNFIHSVRMMNSIISCVCSGSAKSWARKAFYKIIRILAIKKNFVTFFIIANFYRVNFIE